MSRVTYIVVGWNNRDLLEECFVSLGAQTYKNTHIIYVDNDSKDDSVEFVAKQFPKIEIIQTGYNSGFAVANNIGIKEALKDESVSHVALINSDATLDSAWTSKIITFASLKPKGALFQGTTLDYYNHNIVDSTHIFVSHNGQGTQGNWRNYYVKEFGPKRVFGVNAAACMISRAFIEKQPFGDQVLDKSFFMYLEDVDLVTRAVVMGWDNYLVPDARAFHMGSASSGKNPGFSLYMTFRNNTGMLLKNFPIILIIRILPKLIRGDIETIITLRRQKRHGAIRKVLKGRLVGIIRMPLYILKRIKLSRYRKISREDLWNLMSKGY